MQPRFAEAYRYLPKHRTGILLTLQRRFSGSGHGFQSDTVLERAGGRNGAGGQRMNGIAAILLAAGESRRMGERNKLALPVAGVPLLRHMASTLLDSDVGEIVVVVGHAQRTTRDLLEPLPLRLVYNADYRKGHITSVYCGMQALREPCDSIMVCLSDLPLLTAGDINRLVQAFMRCPTPALVPTWQGQRGNPVIVSVAHRDASLVAAGNPGRRRFIDNNPELVSTLAMDNDHVVFDIDTPADYERLLQRLESRTAGVAETRSAAGR